LKPPFFGLNFPSLKRFYQKKDLKKLKGRFLLSAEKSAFGIELGTFPPLHNYRVLPAQKPDTAKVQSCFGRLFKRFHNNSNSNNKQKKTGYNNKGAGGAIKQTCMCLCAASA